MKTGLNVETRVSVCMATYNGQKFIAEQLQSILNELSESDEVVISDDSSTDETVNIISNFNDDRIRLFPDQRFRSPIRNFENALKQARGKYIFLADQDDVWLPGRVQQTLHLFNAYDLIVCDCKIVDENLNVVSDSYFHQVQAKEGLVRNLIRTSPFIGCCMAFSRRVLDVSLPFPSQIPMHDFWIAMVTASRFKTVLYPYALVLYRRHATNASVTGSVSKNSLLTKLSYRINTVIPLLKRLLR